MTLKKDPTWNMFPGALIGVQSLRQNAQKTAPRIGSHAVFLSGSIVYNGAVIGENLTIGHHAVIREENRIGNTFSLWNNAVIDYGCTIGHNVKVHCNCYVAQYSILEDDVFLAPGVILGNDRYPGSKTVKELKGPIIRRGAQIGINATILPGIVIGEEAIVGAGSVVTKDVPPRTVVAGNPARRIGLRNELQDKQGRKPYA
jgi:acetyltransferase-like isoleucine patch superfamily enzyme